MNDTSLDQWRRTRAQGKQRFIWLNGLLLWSVLTGAILYTLLAEMQVLTIGQCLLYSGIGMAGVICVGYWYGNKVWNQNERHYEKLVRRETNQSDHRKAHRMSTNRKPSDVNKQPQTETRVQNHRMQAQKKSLNEYIKEYEQQTAAQLLRDLTRS